MDSFTKKLGLTPSKTEFAAVAFYNICPEELPWMIYILPS